VLAHVLRTRQVSSVHYVLIAEHQYSTEQVTDRLTSIVAGIHKHLNELRDRLADASDSKSEIYDQCLDRLDSIPVTTQVIPWSDLAEKLDEFSATAAVFDVTTLKKNLLVDVVALLLSRGRAGVYSFELMKVPTYGEADLIHALSSAEFTYRSLGDSRHMQLAQKRMLANLLTIRTVLTISAAIGAFVLVVQIFFASTWLQTIVTVAGTATSIAGFLFLLLRTVK
jgi:hypothetical protein